MPYDPLNFIAPPDSLFQQALDQYSADFERMVPSFQIVPPEQLEAATQVPRSSEERAGIEAQRLVGMGLGPTGDVPPTAYELLARPPEEMQAAWDMMLREVLRQEAEKSPTEEHRQKIEEARQEMLNRRPIEAPLQVLAGLQNVGAGVAAGFTDPAMVGATAIGAGAPALASRLISAAFAADMIRNAAGQASEAGAASVTGTPFEKTRAYGGLGLTALMAPALARHALTPTVTPTQKGSDYALEQKNRELYERMRARDEAEQARAQVPPESGSPTYGERGREGRLEEEAQVLLKQEGVSASNITDLLSGKKTAQQVVDEQLGVKRTKGSIDADTMIVEENPDGSRSIGFSPDAGPASSTPRNVGQMSHGDAIEMARQQGVERIQSILSKSQVLLKPESKVTDPKAMADALGMHFDGESHGWRQFTLYDRQGRASDTITLPATATLADAVKRYQLKQEQHGPTPVSPRPMKLGADLILARGETGKTSPEEIEALPAKEFEKVVGTRHTTGSKLPVWRMTVDATEWALKQNPNDAPAIVQKLQAMYDADSARHLAALESGQDLGPSKSQWYGDAIHALTRDQVGRMNIASVTKTPLAKVGPLQAVPKEVPELGITSVTPLEPSTGAPLSATDALINKLESMKFPAEGIPPGGEPIELFSGVKLPHPNEIKAIGRDVWNAAMDTAIAGVKAGKAVADVINTAVEYVKTKVKAFDEGKFRANLTAALGEPKAAKPVEIANKVKNVANDQFNKISDEVSTGMNRRQTKQDIVRWQDGAETTAVNYSRQAGDSVRIQTINPGLLYSLRRALGEKGGLAEKAAAFERYREQAAETSLIRKAAKAVVASGGDVKKLTEFLTQIDVGRKKALAMMKTKGGRAIGERWLRAANALKAEVEYARDHWNDPALKNTANSARTELDIELAFEKQHGSEIEYSLDYIPGRYEGDFWNDKVVSFGGMNARILGKNFRKPKSFANYYEAISQGPFIPKNLDLADLVEHRVRQGRFEVNRKLWFERLKNVIDPASDEPVVAEGKLVEGKEQPPSKEYVGYRLTPMSKLVYVRHGYKGLLDTLTMQSALRISPWTKPALQATALAKHGAILILDTFHPSRLGQYALASAGSKAGYRGGLSALDYREADLAKAVQNGYVTPEAAKWASTEIDVKAPTGATVSMTRRQLLDEMQRQGLNVGRLMDAIYMDVSRNIPVSGALNRFTFDQFTRGLMSESAVRAFEKLNKSHPEVPAQKLIRDVIKDVNIYYGSLGRQGWIRNPTFRDFTQLVFLAPQWVEGLIQKEARFAGRLAMSPVRAAKGEIVFGQLGEAVGKGLVGYFVLTQLINLMTRRQLTFQNEEKGHKLDAWIPTGEDSGFWLSPMSVFAEVTHDVIRLSETKPTVFEGIRQVGMNKLGPWGRMGMVFATREGPYGQRLTSTPEIIRTAAGQLIPTPISLSAPARTVAHALAPETISPPPAGALQRQALAAVGVKVQPGTTRIQSIKALARDWLKEEGLQLPVQITPTDEASYYNLRQALRNDDLPKARRLLAELKKVKTEDQIIRAMTMWKQRPFTGSERNEKLFMLSLDDRQLEQYFNANMDRQELYNKFLDFYLKN